MTGVVTDPSGAPIPGVTVAIVSADTKRPWLALTSGEGRYAVGGLAPGLYELNVGLDGFRRLRRDGVRIATGETLRVDLQLEVGAAEAIQVTADAPLLRSETSGLGQAIDSQTVVGCR